MKRSIGGLLFLSNVVLFSSTAILEPASAQDSSCYYIDSSGKRRDLGALCGNSATPTSRNAFQARIKRRDRGTPVIDVTFNGGQTFEMILDTGASGTLITRRMAAALRVRPIGVVLGDTASAKGVEFPVGYVQRIAVGGAVAQNVLVAIAGPEQDLGLLGNDFFSNYDVIIRRDVVEFRPRRG